MAEYRAWLVDTVEARRFDLGVYKALDAITAEQAARRKFKNLVGRLSTGLVRIECEAYFGPPVAKARGRRSKDTTVPLL